MSDAFLVLAQAPAGLVALGEEEQPATTLQGALLTRLAPAYVAGGFVASRVAEAHGYTFGTLASDVVHASAGRMIGRSFAL